MIAIDRQPNKEKSKLIETLEEHKEQEHPLENRQKQEENKEDRVHIFSKRAQKQMERSIEKLKDISNEDEGWRFIRKNRKKRRIQVFQYRLLTNATKISALAICLISVFFVASFFTKSNAEAWKIPFLNISVEWRDDKLEIRTAEADDNSLDLKDVNGIYEFDLSTEGYEKIEEILSKKHCYIEYEDKSGDKIVWMQTSLNSPLYTQTIIEKYSKKEVDGITYYFMEGEKGNAIIWLDNNYQYQLSGSKSINTLIKMTKLKKIFR